MKSKYFSQKLEIILVFFTFFLLNSKRTKLLFLWLLNTLKYEDDYLFKYYYFFFLAKTCFKCWVRKSGNQQEPFLFTNKKRERNVNLISFPFIRWKLLDLFLYYNGFCILAITSSSFLPLPISRRIAYCSVVNIIKKWHELRQQHCTP